jgi:hypothetical protein
MPSLVGYRPDEAEAAAQTLGENIVWVEAPPPRRLSPQRETRVGRQRVRDDGHLELLRVWVPVATAGEGNTP